MDCDARTATLAIALAALGACDLPDGIAPQSPKPTEIPATPPAQARPRPAPTPSGEAALPAPAFVPERVYKDGAAMGTHVVFLGYTTEAANADKVRAAFDDALSEIRRLEAVMTTWRPDSEISKINAAAGKNAVTVGDETLRMITESVHTSEISEGTFDITFQTLHGLWKFDQDLSPHPPTDAAIRARLPFVGYRNIVVDPEHKTVKLTHAETQIGLGGIAKGYAVDRAVEVLDQAGLKSFLVQAGGDLFARGKKPDGTDWQAGIRDPRGSAERFFAKLNLTNYAFSTAGDYERSYIVHGKRYHHIIDPRTGYPATASRSVTIWAPTALLADEVDDAVFILGPEKGLKLIESLDGVGAVVVDAKNHVWISQRLIGKVQVVTEPTDAL